MKHVSPPRRFLRGDMLLFNIFWLLSLFLTCYQLNNNKSSYGEDNAYGKADPRALDKARDNKHYKGDSRNGDRVGELS